ncbi:MAG: hypothetical protein O3B13_05135 [Planctomycetota bacterium]|nr:hypothetical protein [Planctomycetota bacterium]
MNFSIRMRVVVAAGMVVAAGLVGCQTCRDCVDRLPRPSLPSIHSIMPFRKSGTPTYAEPYRAPQLEAVPDGQAPLILPEPGTASAPERFRSRPVSNPPTLPPFEAETPVPSAGLFPSGPVRRMGFETSSVIRDSNIIQTGCCAPIVSSCCPPPCCPTTCCETSCCSTGCGLASAILGTVAHPFYLAKYKVQNVKDHLRCKLSSFGSSCCAPSCNPCWSPCSSPCNPCGNSCVVNEYVMEGVVVNQYPTSGGCSTCNSGVGSVQQFQMHQHQMVPQQQWQQPATPYQPAMQQYSQPQYPPQPQYQGGQPVYSQPQIAFRQPVPQQQYQPAYRPAVTQQPVVQQYQPQQAQQSQIGNAQQPVAPSQQRYSAPQPVEPLPQAPAAPASNPAPGPSTSSLSPGYSPLPGQAPSTRVTQVFRATRFQ